MIRPGLLQHGRYSWIRTTGHSRFVIRTKHTGKSDLKPGAQDRPAADQIPKKTIESVSSTRHGPAAQTPPELYAQKVAPGPSFWQRLRQRSPVKWKGIFVGAFGFTLSFWVAVVVRSEFSDKKSDSRTDFQRYILVGREYYSSTSSIITLKAQNDMNWAQAWKSGIWSVEIKQPQLQIAREYTPLPQGFVDRKEHDAGLQSRDTLNFWIRREPSGELSNYLHKLEPGSTVEIRGPKSQTDIPDADEIVFLAGGTGIAPALQMAYELLRQTKNSGDLPNIHILWANRRREDCLGGLSDHDTSATKSNIYGFFKTPSKAAKSGKTILVERLDKLKEAFQGKLHVDYFVDDENSRITQQTVLSRLKSKREADSKRVVMVCGPDGFVDHFAGPKQWFQGKQTQGRIAGVLQDAESLGWQVIKL